MLRQKPAKKIQCLRITPAQIIEQRAQLLVICQSVLYQSLAFRIVQQWQERLLFDLEVRFKLISKDPDDTLAGLIHLLSIARLCGPPACFRQRKRGVMFT